MSNRNPDPVVVVHLFGSLERGGAETRTLELLRRRAGKERHILIALSGRTGALDSEFERLGYTVVHRRLSATFPIWFVWFLQRSNATHVHSHVHFASGYFLALAFAAGVPRRIAHFRSTGDGRCGSWRRAVYRWVGALLVCSCATDAVMVSQAVARSTLGACCYRRKGLRIQVLYNQVDGAQYVVPSSLVHLETSPRLISVGRLDRDKNPQRAIELFAVLRGRRTDASLDFVGRYSSSDREVIVRRIEALGLTEAVSILGQRDDMSALLGRCDLVLSTTLREGLPGSIVEAAAAGVPAVVSAIPANEEVAALLPSVIAVPLEASNDAWCDVIEDVLDARAGRLNPVAVRTWFDESPLCLEDEAREFGALWS